MPIKELLNSDAQTLLLTFAEEIRSVSNPDRLSTVYTGALLATKARILPEHSQYRPDYCTEQDCVKARHAIMQLLGLNLLTMVGTLPPNPHEPKWELPANGKGLYWPWLKDTGFSLTREGFLYAEWLQSPRYRKLGRYLKGNVWPIVAAIVAILILVLTVLQNRGT